MDEIADRVLDTYEFIGELDPARVTLSREKIVRYIEKLASAGHRDTDQLVEFALAYLKELHEGPDPGFTGC
jgi:hypothetical protein